jgi:hypothetical protein
MEVTGGLHGTLTAQYSTIVAYFKAVVHTDHWCLLQNRSDMANILLSQGMVHSSSPFHALGFGYSRTLFFHASERCELLVDGSSRSP